MYYLRALELERKTFGENHPPYVRHLNQLASMYDTLGRYAEAIPHYEKVIQFMRVTASQEPDKLARTINCLAILYWLDGRYAEAEPCYEEVLNMMVAELGPRHPNVVAYAESYGNMLRQAKRAEYLNALQKKLPELQACLSEG